MATCGSGFSGAFIKSYINELLIALQLLVNSRKVTDIRNLRSQFALTWAKPQHYLSSLPYKTSFSFIVEQHGFQIRRHWLVALLPSRDQIAHAKPPIQVNMPLHAEQVSWSLDGFTTPTDGSNTPPSSVESPLEKGASLPPDSIVQLPAPFYPPSLVQRDPSYKEKCNIPRAITSDLDYPEVPRDKACEEIDSPDM